MNPVAVVLAVVATASAIAQRVFNVIIDGVAQPPVTVTPDVVSTTIQVPPGKSYSFSTDVIDAAGQKATSPVFSGSVPAPAPPPAPPAPPTPPTADSSPTGSVAPVAADPNAAVPAATAPAAVDPNAVPAATVPAADPNATTPAPAAAVATDPNATAAAPAAGATQATA